MLAERYTVLHPLGHGGMGMVVAAYDARLNRRVALKLLRPRWSLDDSESQVRLLREAQAMARLSHPHVVQVYDSGRLEDDSVFIAMEHVEGQTLRQWLRQQPRPWSEVLPLFLEAGQGLAAAHAAGLVHRDFKPDNVLLGQDGRVRVTDFGVAQPQHEPDTGGPAQAPPLPRTWVEPLTETGKLMGTPRYMAPEQLKGQPVDARSDLFAFCVALYEALYGVCPFAGESVTELLEARTAGRLTLPPNQREVPAWLNQAMARGLRADPLQRPGSMHELLLVLRNAPAQRRWARLRTVALAGAGAVLLAAAVWGWARHPEPGSASTGMGGRRAGIGDARLQEQPRSQAEAISLQVAQLGALHRAGKFTEGLELAKQLQPWVTALNDAPLQARALYWRAQLLDGAGDYPGSEAALREALVLSAQGKDAALEALIWNLLVTSIGTRQGRYAEAMVLELPLKAAAQRVGDEVYLALALEALGDLHSKMGQHEQGREHYAQALARLERAQGPGETRESFERTLALKLELLGDGHPGAARSPGHSSDRISP
jgi:serine/threonine-protein kinase